jgi:catechol 2,3-dioxygenase-like lactoylglutathione lyase family enzyme
MNRRELLRSLPALAVAPRLLVQGSKPTIPVKALNHFKLLVSDVKRSVDFYQGLFGMPVQIRQGSTVLLRIGGGPQFMAIGPTEGSAPSIAPLIGMSVDKFNANQLTEVLAQHGIMARTSVRGVDKGGTKAGTPELFFNDPDGLTIQLSDPKYCGGSGALGEICPKPEPSPKKGLIELKDLNHFTINESDGNRSNAFYQELFGLNVRSRQGAALGLGVGPGKMFVMFAGGGGRGGATPRPASINHVCMNMEGFNSDNVLKTLASYGISPRENAQGPVGPLKSYVSLRMENRGGAPGGTPELYFTDPDGLLIQLQDVMYCGGAGILGDVCAG